MGTPFLEIALKYLDRGFSVIPIKANKKPYIKWEEFQKRRPTPEEVGAWWGKWPKAMIGICTGEISGILVIDCDTPEGYEAIQKLLPDAILLPVARTPRGGWHLWFLYPAGSKITVGTGIMPGVDFRAEGGYVITPPSINGDGKGYTWQEGLALGEVEPAPVPSALLNALNNNDALKNNNALYRGGYKADLTEPYETLQYLTKGRRDSDLFHAANCLVKGGCELPFIEQVIDILARNSNPPFPENEIRAKIESALKRAERRERNLKQEVLEWVTLQDGYWNLTEPKKTLQVLTREEKSHIDVIIHRLKKDGIIEKYGSQAGVYRTVQGEIEPVNFLTAPTDEFPIIWPMDIHAHCIIYPGNIIIVAGSKGAGKTAYLLNTTKMNMPRHEIVYLNSEMGDTEFRKRLELFEDMKLTDWNFKPEHRMGNFADRITPDKKIFIVDFLEVTSDFWKVAQYIQEIHRKLKEGIAIIALQKSDAKEMGRGGDFSREKARLYLSLDYLHDEKVNRIKITDAKAWRSDRNPRGMYHNYKLVKGSRFIPVGDWRD